MALDCSLGSMGILNDLFDGSCEQAVECDITLPDYCPDIARVLKCTVTPAVVSSKISGDRACADGSVCVRLVYCGEDSGIYSYEHECPFSKYAELGGEKNGSLITDIKTEYVNCRAISGRRAEVRAMLHISFKITALSQRSIITSVERQGVQTQKYALDISDIVACECKQFTVNETVELPADYLPADRIISVCAVPILNDTKIVKDKILIKGEAAVTVIYFSNGSGCETSKYCYSLFISQIVDMPGIDENCSADVTLKTVGVQCVGRNDAQSEIRLLDISVCIEACVKAYAQSQLECITDAYCIDGELSADYEPVDFYKSVDRFSDTFTSKCPVDFSSLDAQSIAAMWFDEPTVHKKISNSHIRISGTAPFNAITLDFDGKPSFCSREIDFEYSRKVDAPDDAVCTPCVSLNAYSVGQLNDSKAEIKAEFSVGAQVFERKTARALVSADVAEREKERLHSSAMIVYFPDEDEKMWDIARKFNTTVELIEAENASNNSGALLIPVI